MPDDFTRQWGTPGRQWVNHSLKNYVPIKIVAKAEAVENNSEIAREYGISESMVPSLEERSGKSVQRGAYQGAYPDLDQQPLAWFSEQRSQGKIFPLMHTVFFAWKMLL